jgi:hypothetical protein
MERDFIREEFPLAAVFSILIAFTVTLLYIYSSGEALLVEPNRIILLSEIVIGIVAIVYVGNKLRKRFVYRFKHKKIKLILPHNKVGWLNMNIIIIKWRIG